MDAARIAAAAGRRRRRLALPAAADLLALYYADAGQTLNGTTVAAAADQSSAGAPALVQATAIRQPTLTPGAVGGRAGWTLNGSQWLATASNLTLPGYQTILVVMGATTTRQIIAAHGLLSADGSYLYGPGGPAWALQRSFQRYATAANWIPASACVLVVSYGAANLSVEVNGAAVSFTITGNTAPANTNLAAVFSVGGFASGTQLLTTGVIAAVAVYGRQLASAERLAEARAAGAYYGIAVA